MLGGILIFQPIINNTFIKNYCSGYLTWNGGYIDEIKNYVNKIPAKLNKKLFLISPANQFITLEPYTFINHYIECIKVIFGLNCIPYNICLYKGIQYIMYSSQPEFEFTYSLLTKNGPISDCEKRNYLFHWILGVRGKFMCLKNGDQYIYYSRANYGNINSKRNNLSKNAIKRIFGNVDEIRRILHSFIDEEKIYNLRCLLEVKNYEWFYSINTRIYLYF